MNRFRASFVPTEMAITPPSTGGFSRNDMVSVTGYVLAEVAAEAKLMNHCPGECYFVFEQAINKRTGEWADVREFNCFDLQPTEE